MSPSRGRCGEGQAAPAGPPAPLTGLIAQQCWGHTGDAGPAPEDLETGGETDSEQSNDNRVQRLSVTGQAATPGISGEARRQGRTHEGGGVTSLKEAVPAQRIGLVFGRERQAQTLRSASTLQGEAGHCRACAVRKQACTSLVRTRWQVPTPGLGRI